MSILLIAGSPSEASRSSALLDAVSQRLQRRGARVERLLIRDLSPQALLLGDVAHRSVQYAVDQVARAHTVVVATPVYKAAYSGVLKVFLDLLSQSAFKGKAVLPLATGGSPNHMLALDYALRPVLQSLAARHVLPGVYATESQVTITPEGAWTVDAELGLRLDEAVANLAAEGHLGGYPNDPGRPAANAAAHDFEAASLADVRCSV